MTPMSKSKRKSAPQGAKLVREGKPARLSARAAPLTRPKNGLDGFEFLTPCEAIAWAAFGKAIKADDLISVFAPELGRWSNRPKIWLPKLFSSYEPFGLEEYSPRLILDTILAFDDPAKNPDVVQRHYLAFYMARRKSLGLSDLPKTSDHIEFLRRYLGKAAELEMKLIESKREFQKLIGLGHICLSGRPFDQRQKTDRFVVAPHSSRSKISKEVFLPGISIDFEGCLTDSNGQILFQDLIVDLDDVRRCYPFGSIEPINPVLLQPQQSPNTSRQPETVRQLKGGRPRGESTLLAQSELARLLASGKLPKKPRDILAHLEEFFEREGKTMPAESTLKEMIRAFLEGLKQSRNPSENLAGN